MDNQIQDHLSSSSSSKPLREMDWAMEPLQGSEGLYMPPVLFSSGSMNMLVGMNMSVQNSMMIEGTSLRQTTNWYQQEQLSSSRVQKMTRKSFMDRVSSWSLPQQATMMVMAPVQTQMVKGKQVMRRPTPRQLSTLRLLTRSLKRPRLSTSSLSRQWHHHLATPSSHSQKQTRMTAKDILIGFERSLMKDWSARQATPITRSMKLKMQSRFVFTLLQNQGLTDVTDVYDSFEYSFHLNITNCQYQGSTMYSDWDISCRLEQNLAPIQDNIFSTGSIGSRWKSTPST